MSRASKLTLAGTSLFAVSTIIFVHFQQTAEQSVRRPPFRLSCTPQASSNAPLQAMHQGVVRDMEQQRVKRERQLDFDMQRVLEEEYKREQNVHSSIDSQDKPATPPR